MSTHVLSVSPEGVVRSLRHQFTRSTTFLSEALQNARRAGASEVRVSWDPDIRIMTIADDGNGIRAFDALFTLGRSGWDAEIIAQENPFGVGFMAAVLASEHISIRSLDRQVAFETRKLLNFAEVEVQQAPRTPCDGTELKLKLRANLLEPVKSSLKENERWEALLTEMVFGFPISVYFNGRTLPRLHALASGKTFFNTEVGQIFLQGWDECEPNSLNYLPHLYYQGLPIQVSDRHLKYSQDILHLDQQRFRELDRYRRAGAAHSQNDPCTLAQALGGTIRADRAPDLRGQLLAVVQSA